MQDNKNKKHKKKKKEQWKNKKENRTHLVECLGSSKTAMVGDMTDFQDGLGEYGKQRFRELVTTRDERVEQRLSELFRKTDEPKK